MSIDALNAANAYRNQMKMMESTPLSAGEDGASQPSFMQMVQSATQDAINTQTSSEATQLQSVTGKVELSDLVTAVASAELSLNTVVAIRDRVINAYNDIIKM